MKSALNGNPEILKIDSWLVFCNPTQVPGTITLNNHSYTAYQFFNAFLDNLLFLLVIDISSLRWYLWYLSLLLFLPERIVICKVCYDRKCNQLEKLEKLERIFLNGYFSHDYSMPTRSEHFKHHLLSSKSILSKMAARGCYKHCRLWLMEDKVWHYSHHCFSVVTLINRSLCLQTAMCSWPFKYENWMKTQKNEY